LDAPASIYRAAVVADDPVVRTGLAALLSAYPGLSVVSATGEPSARPSLSAPEVLVWDLDADAGAPAGFGTDVPVVALVRDAGAYDGALRAGAKGVLVRSVGGEQLGSAVVAVAEGNVVLSPAVYDALLGARPKPVAGPPLALTPREFEVLELLAEGLSNRLIAARLGISEHTAKFHVNAILDKLGAETRTEAVVLAARSGVLSL
jgi:two-component system nitrate/nitrite response regulator NarL